MRVKSILARLAALLLLGIFIVYIGYQVVSNLGDGIVTIDAMVVTVEDVISVDGLFARSQILVRGAAGLTAEYRVSDGEKVARGQELVLFLESGAAVSDYQALEHLDAQIAALEHVKRSMAGGADAKKLDSQIYDSLLELSGLLDSGNTAKAAAAYPMLLQLIVTRGASAGQDYTARIDALRAERRAVQSSLSGSAVSLSAERSGYFFRYPDGYETVLRPEALAEMTPEALAGLTPDLSAFEPDVAGTIIDSYEWYFIAVADKEQADKIRDRASLRVYFPQLGTQAVTVALDSVTTYGSQAVLIFKSSQMDSTYLGARRQPADLVVASHTGVKVPRDALRQQDDQWGVYCLEGALYKFKPVKWIYQTDTYVLVELAENSDHGLYMYDKIITRGKQLADNKVVR